MNEIVIVDYREPLLLLVRSIDDESYPQDYEMFGHMTPKDWVAVLTQVVKDSLIGLSAASELERKTPHLLHERSARAKKADPEAHFEALYDFMDRRLDAFRMELAAQLRRHVQPGQLWDVRPGRGEEFVIVLVGDGNALRDVMVGAGQDYHALVTALYHTV